MATLLKPCKKCGETKEHMVNKRVQAYCRDCHSLYKKNRGREAREKIIRHLGSICVECSADDFRCLQIDHVNGGGRKDRARFSNDPTKFYKAVMETEPGIYQLLCANCNAIKKYERGE